MMIYVNVFEMLPTDVWRVEKTIVFTLKLTKLILKHVYTRGMFIILCHDFEKL